MVLSGNGVSMVKETFIQEDFLLENQYAKKLYFDYAKDLPIIDYHCHLPPDQIATNHQFDNLTQIWLDGDHYKWRAMRTNGVSETFITGDATDWKKFDKWAATLPYTLRNPLFHWSQLELKRYFSIDQFLNPQTARLIYDQCQAKLAQSDFAVRGLLEKMNVEVICTTDDPIDDLRCHQQLQKEGYQIKVLPAFRPDKAILINTIIFNDYLQKLGVVADQDISSFTDLKAALTQRANYFHQNGCRLSDHGLERLYFEKYTDGEIERILQKRLHGKLVSPVESAKYQTAILQFLGQLYHEKGWTQQFHLGALRNNNTRMMRLLGPDTGFDSIGDFSQARSLAQFLDSLDQTDQLAKTILYNLNPADNEVMATMIGNFNDGSVTGKIQYGSSWWFLDQLDGMEKQMNALSNMGLISQFVGMLTDSRSFLSYPRHEYFRRLLCNLFGRDMAKGHLPKDMNWVGKIVQDICYHNAKKYFDFSSSMTFGG
ncbi:MAG: glucuronate isomerase [Bacteroidota bacterium]